MNLLRERAVGIFGRFSDTGGWSAARRPQPLRLSG